MMRERFPQMAPDAVVVDSDSGAGGVTVGVMRAAFSAYSPKSAAGLCAFSRKIRAGSFPLWERSFSVKTRS